jgi:hypothetical protein
MRDESSEKIRDRILSLVESEFESDVAFERALELPPKTVNNWRRGLSSSYMKLLPRISELLKINVGELLDMPLVGDSSELSEDEMKLLKLYRKSRTLPSKLRQSLSESLESIINLYLKSTAELKRAKRGDGKGKGRKE